MAEGDIIMISQKELRYLAVIRKILEKRINKTEAAKILDISRQQVIRITKRVFDEGEKGLLHRLRGRTSNRAYPKEVKKAACKLYRDKYWDFGPTLASEKLFEIDNIKLSDETLRSWLLESGDWQKRKKGRKHRKWRDRKVHCGQMLQGDGSHHKWFEDRGPECVLMGFIDDATSRVYARFYEYEGTIPAMDMMKRYLRKYGIPVSLYMDNHATYKARGKATIEDELAGREPLSQFERGVKELGMEFIHARSPQAKGRIERLFKTFQDRVLKEMRLANVGSIREGNTFLRGYLPKYNKRFGVIAKDPADLHRELPDGLELDAYLCIKTLRTIRNDYTVTHDKKLYQVISMTKAKKVTAEDRISGKVVIREYSGRLLDYVEIKSRPKKRKEEKPKIKLRKRYIPPMSHPYKKSMYDRRYPQINSYPQKEKSSKKEKELLLLVH